MPVKSKYRINIPNCHLASLVFGSPSEPLSNEQRCYIDHARPETHYLTRHTFRLWSQRLAAGLRASGLQVGDRVFVFSTNHLFFPVVFMGVVMAGGIFTAANPAYSAKELAHQMRDADPKFVLAKSGPPMQTACEAAAIVGVTPENVFVFDSAVFESLEQPGELGHRYWSALIAPEAEGAQFAWDPLTSEIAAQQTLALNYSSGTTGLSKGVEITHKNYTANILQYNFISNLEVGGTKRNEEHWLCFLPMYHSMAQMLYVGMSQIRQIPTYIMEKFDFLTVLQNIEKYRITSLQLVPPVVIMFAKNPQTRKYDLSSIKTIGAGAAPLSRETCQEMEALWPKGQVNIKQGWGMTECTCAMLGWDPNLISTTNSVGWPHANSEVKIMSLPDLSHPDPSSHVPVELGPNQNGEIWARGPQVMKGYWRNPSATKETLTPDGWLRSGDVGHYDDEGKFYITGRLKELIKVKGLQVAPAELDGVCLDCAEVADAAIVGVSFGGTEHPRAYIVLKEGVPATSKTAKRIQDTVNSKLTKFKWITGGVVFVDTLPKNQSGKILRRLLQQRAEKEIAEEMQGQKLWARI